MLEMRLSHPFRNNLALAVTVALSCGCVSLPKQSLPELARQPYNARQQEWADAVKRWMPAWEEPVLPYPARTLSPPPPSAPSRPIVQPPAPASRPVARSSQPQPIIDDRSDRTAGGSPARSQSFVIIDEQNAATAHGTVRHHRIMKGETLAQLARRYYGDAQAWRRIYNANRDIVANPNQVKPGTLLRIP